jgi:hypothetical protein
MTTPDIDPFALAVWLHGEARTAYALADAAADPYGAAVTRESAAKLELASQIVKEMADLQRKERTADNDAGWPRRA